MGSNKKLKVPCRLTRLAQSVERQTFKKAEESGGRGFKSPIGCLLFAFCFLLFAFSKK